MKRLTITLSALSLGFLFLIQPAAGQTETQNFSSEASATDAGWTVNDEGANPERDCADCVTDLGQLIEMPKCHARNGCHARVLKSKVRQIVKID